MGIQGQVWPLPFSIAPVLALRGKRVAVLASGDPFWHGVGGTFASVLEPGEYRSFPAASSFSLACAAMGWRIEDIICLGLHAAPLTQLRPMLTRGQRIICLLRDGQAVGELAAYLTQSGFGPSQITALQALGGPREKHFSFQADCFEITDISAPVCAAVTVRGALGLPTSNGIDDALFEHDGQITKRWTRAVTLSALAPRVGDILWDIGAGSGSVSIEFLLCAAASQSHAVESDPSRAARAISNAEAFGLGHRFHLSQVRAPEGLANLPRPDAVFIGGGASDALLSALWRLIPTGTRLVANAVTLENEALFIALQARHGGTLLRIDLSQATSLGTKRGWQAMRPIVQWSVTK